MMLSGWGLHVAGRPDLHRRHRHRLLVPQKYAHGPAHVYQGRERWGGKHHRHRRHLSSSGIIVGSIAITGLGVSFSSVVLALSQGSLFITLLFTAIICMILGLSLPTTASYIITAAVGAPALLKLGFPPWPPTSLSFILPPYLPLPPLYAAPYIPPAAFPARSDENRLDRHPAGNCSLLGPVHVRLPSGPAPQRPSGRFSWRVNSDYWNCRHQHDLHRDLLLGIFGGMLSRGSSSSWPPSSLSLPE